MFNQQTINRKKTQGFTLIELLVVVAVIGILIALILPNLVGMRQRALDVKKKSDLAQIKNALRMYYNDYNAYPQNSGSSICCSAPTSCASACVGSLAISGGETYTKDLPTTFVWTYTQLNSGEGFRLTVDLENASDKDILTSQTRCGYGSGKTYVVCQD